MVPQRKKKTPSTLRRDARRREELLKKKLNASTVNSSQSEQASAKEAEAPKKAPTVLQHHPSPPSSSERRQVIVVGREKAVPSFNQLDGQEDMSLLDAAPSSEEKKEDIVALETWPCDPLFCERYKVPPRKVRHFEPVLGIGTFERIDEKSGNFVYEFENGHLIEL